MHRSGEVKDSSDDNFGTESASGDSLFSDVVEEDAVKDEAVRQAAEANSRSNFGYVFGPKLTTLFIDSIEQNADIFDRLITDNEMPGLVSDSLQDRIDGRVRNAE